MLISLIMDEETASYGCMSNNYDECILEVEKLNVKSTSSQVKLEFNSSEHGGFELSMTTKDFKHFYETIKKYAELELR